MMNVLNLSQRLLTGSLAVVTALAVLTAGGDTVRAQSVSRIPSGPRTQSAKNSVVLEGYCPVCVIKIKKWVRGNPHYAATYDGKTYYFPGEDQKQMFLADPAKYVPALGGDCTVCSSPSIAKTEVGRLCATAYHAIARDSLVRFRLSPGHSECGPQCPLYPQ